MPETIHAITSQKGELTVREISAETMKMPDPIMEPATSIVASVSVSALTNSRDDGAISAVAVVVVNALPQMLGFRRVFPSCTARGSYSGKGEEGSGKRESLRIFKLCRFTLVVLLLVLTSDFSYSR